MSAVGCSNRGLSSITARSFRYSRSSRLEQIEFSSYISNPEPDSVSKDIKRPNASIIKRKCRRRCYRGILLLLKSLLARYNVVAHPDVQGAGAGVGGQVKRALRGIDGEGAEDIGGWVLEPGAVLASQQDLLDTLEVLD